MTTKAGGRVVRIKLKGFMCHDDLEIHPHNCLNLIIGLNGSGKSSIMSAICLGLGGKPRDTGKTIQLSEFIKTGHTKAIIEIDLESPHDRKDVITRVIQPEKQLWYLNNKIVQQNEIMSVVKKYNIDMSNLCQFLPQEKVSEFSKMDKKQRLVNMIQAIGEPRLATLFDELKKLRNEFCQFGKDLEELENNKISEEKMNERLKPEIEKQEERMKLISELNIFKIKKMACEYEIIKEKLSINAAEDKQLNRDSKRMEEKSEELKNENGNLSSEFNNYQKELEELGAKIYGFLETLTQYYHNLEECHEEVDNAKINFENRMLEKKDQKAKLTAINMQIEGLKEALAQKKGGDMALLKEKLVQIGKNYENVKHQLSACHSSIERVNSYKNKVEYKKKSKKHEIDRISNEEDKKYEILRQKYPDTYTALKWLQQNENSFRAHVSPPPLVSIQVKNDEYRKFIENSVADRDLLMFVCEDKGDLERFMKIMKHDKKLSVNVSMVPDESLADFKSPPITNAMRNLGIHCYLKDLFSAPDPVMRILCKLNRVHQVPVCTEQAERNIDAILNYSTLFFTTSERISGKRSKYGQKSMSVKRDVLWNRNVLPNIKDNSAALLSAQKELQEMEKEAGEYKSQFDALETQRTQLERQQEQLRLEKSGINMELGKLNELKIKHDQLIATYKRKERELVDEIEEKKKVTDTVQGINSKKMDILEKMNKIIKDILQQKNKKAMTILQMRVHVEKISSLEDKIKRLENDHNNIKSRLEELKSEKNLLKTEGRKLQQLIQANGPEAKTVVLGTREHDLEEIECQISNIEAQLELTNDGTADVLAEYKKREQKILSIDEQMNSLKAKIEELKKRIQEKKGAWLPPLVTHIESVNRKFSKYYKILKCAGEISLDQTEDTDDFPNYGLQLKLKYRVDEEFMELSQTHHSGGECSVAAIIFILSLQELTDVPFRCIDEINQGMDAINERKIYQLIADAARSGSCSQYFLLTPKLLMDLSYHKDVVVHTIFNSRHLHAKLNVKEDLRIAKANRQ